MESELMISLFVGGGLLVLASSITFCFRMLSKQTEMTAAMTQVTAALVDLRKSFEADAKDKSRLDLERDKVWSRIHAQTSRLVEMHEHADAWGFGTKQVMASIADSQRTLVSLTGNVEKLGNAVVQMQKTQRWIIENTDSIKGKLPPAMPEAVPGIGR